MVIGLAGPAGCGKSTVAGVLVSHYGFTKLAFADPIKEMLSVIVSKEYLYEKKQTPVPLIRKTARELMQSLGTEWGRNMVGQDVWVDELAVRAAMISGPIVVDDVRYENEARYIRNVGILVHLSRDGFRLSGHSSEDGVLHAPGDILFNNEMPTETLAESLREIVRAADKVSSKRLDWVMR